MCTDGQVGGEVHAKEGGGGNRTGNKERTEGAENRAAEKQTSIIQARTGAFVVSYLGHWQAMGGGFAGVRKNLSSEDRVHSGEQARAIDLRRHAVKRAASPESSAYDAH
jgi:hypothetical protein